jgi:hypothetical protein
MPEPSARGAREHFGLGRLAAEPARAVFINCPYDREFAPTFDAIVFATVCCGFLPRSALESGSVAVSRMERIVEAIFSCKYSIHDLSRCRGEGDEQLARFNMPLELGIAMARRYIGPSDSSDRHDWLLLVPEQHAYAKFLSDLGGFDPLRYDGRTEQVVPPVMSWLATRPDTLRAPTPKAVLATLPQFHEAKLRLQEEWQGDVPWADLVLAALEIARPLLL